MELGYHQSSLFSAKEVLLNCQLLSASSLLLEVFVVGVDAEPHEDTHKQVWQRHEEQQIPRGNLHRQADVVLHRVKKMLQLKSTFDYTIAKSK